MSSEQPKPEAPKEVALNPDQPKLSAKDLQQARIAELHADNKSKDIKDDDAIIQERILHDARLIEDEARIRDERLEVTKKQRDLAEAKMRYDLVKKTGIEALGGKEKYDELTKKLKELPDLLNKEFSNLFTGHWSNIAFGEKEIESLEFQQYEFIKDIRFSDFGVYDRMEDKILHGQDEHRMTPEEFRCDPEQERLESYVVVRAHTVGRHEKDINNRSLRPFEDVKRGDRMKYNYWVWYIIFELTVGGKLKVDFRFAEQSMHLKGHQIKPLSAAIKERIREFLPDIEIVMSNERYGED